jgi:hypothetical protein
LGSEAFKPALACKTKHDSDKWGQPRIEGTPPIGLVTLADLVRFVMDRDGLPLIYAAAFLLDAIESAAPSPALYKTDPKTWAALLPEDYCWRKPVKAVNRQVVPAARNWATQFVDSSQKFRVIDEQKAVIGLFGRSGALVLLRRAWVEKARGVADLELPPYVCLAVLEFDAVRMVGYGCNPVRVAVMRSDSEPNSEQTLVELIVRPAGGTWPRDPKKPWSEAEREAAFTMRHKHRMPDKKLASVVGATRQAINEQIGPARLGSNGAPRLGKTKWFPSDELRAECGLPVNRPLQSALRAFGRPCSKAA